MLSWYEKVLGWSRHPKATRYLALLSFIDASLFPISPLFMFLPMSFAEPNRAFSFASITTIASLIGGAVGYALGLFAFEILVNPFIQMMGYEHYYQMSLQWFQTWGFLAIIMGCLSPIIPYKIFTIGAGVMQLNFGWFLLASAIGRTLRFFLIAAFIRWGGPKVEPLLRKTLTRISEYQHG
jgi:membrane protein YqaA with SNARE-associated domain